jgi:hypothetical protein
VKIPNKGICTKKCWDRVDMDRDTKKSTYGRTEKNGEGFIIR